MLQTILYNAKQSILKRIKFRTQMCVAPKHDQKHIKLIPKFNQKNEELRGSKGVLKH